MRWLTTEFNNLSNTVLVIKVDFVGRSVYATLDILAIPAIHDYCFCLLLQMMVKYLSAVESANHSVPNATKVCPILSSAICYYYNCVVYRVQAIRTLSPRIAYRQLL